MQRLLTEPRTGYSKAASRQFFSRSLYYFKNDRARGSPMPRCNQNSFIHNGKLLLKSRNLEMRMGMNTVYRFNVGKAVD